MRNMRYINFKFDKLIVKEDVEIYKCEVFIIHLNNFVNLTSADVR